jgi:TatA/E family protein of Tat protein translocase
MVGFDEIILIAVVVLLLFGPDKLPQYLRELGKLYAEVKKAQREFERELNPGALVTTPPGALVSAPAIKMPSPQVIEIAKKLGISTDGKTEEELLQEIDAAVPRPAAESSPTNVEQDN